MKKNPFTPNFGQIPLHIAGRSTVISDVLHGLDDSPGNPARTSIIIGPRGSGKTALLSYFSRQSIQMGWISVNVTCISGLQDDILQQAYAGARNLIPEVKGHRVSGISVGSLFSVSWEKETGSTPNWRTRITHLLNELEKTQTGLFITIDEVTPSLEEMIQVASVYQLLIREERKISMLMAGLPSSISALLNDKSVSFLRRASQYTLGRIDDQDIGSAFVKTLEVSGKSIAKRALQDAVRAIDGFPYMMQLVGYRSFENSNDRPQITQKDVREGIRMAQADFETRVIKSTLFELSAVDRSFLCAMLPDEIMSSVSELEKRLKKNSGYISRYRARLIEAGVIESPTRGYVAFAIPGLRDYLLREVGVNGVAGHPGDVRSATTAKQSGGLF